MTASGASSLEVLVYRLKVFMVISMHRVGKGLLPIVSLTSSE